MTNQEKYFIFDIHVHPSLKTFMFNKRLYRRYPSGGAWNPLFMQVDLPTMKDGNVRTIISSIYLPEKKMIDDCLFLKALILAVGVFNKNVKKILRHNPFEVTLEIINHVEKTVAKAVEKGWKEVVIARSVTELKQAHTDGKVIILHAVEGAHSLNGDLNNIHKLFERGICMLTLAHFYENEFTQTVGGIPSDKKILGCFKHESEQQGGLSDLGRELVKEMLRIGILVDMTHCTPFARSEIFNLNNGQRPLIFSHSGVSVLNSHHMNPTDDEIKKIADSGGIIGIIFMNHWLSPAKQKNGLDLILSTIKHIQKIGGIEAIAIGSDFDGFTDTPDDIKDSADMPKLVNVLKQAGFNNHNLELICYKNAMRTILAGWAKN